MRIWIFIYGWLRMVFRIRRLTSNAGSGIIEISLADKILALCMLGLFATAYGAENERIAEASANLPDLEFLEFLGQFETDEGEWIDPGSLMAEEFTMLLNATVLPDSNSPISDNDTDVQQSND